MVHSKVCAWDVGIKNLPFCIVEKEDKVFKLKSENWDIINIIDSDKVVCGATVKKSGQVCGKKPTFQGLNEGEIIYYCKSHQDQHPIKTEVDTQIKHEDQLDDCHFEGRKKCDKKSKYTIDGKNYCPAHKTSMVNKILNESKLKKIAKKKCTSTGPEILAEKLFNKLDNHPRIKEILAVDEILIENQPAFKNPTMKSIGTMLFSYFVMKGIVEKEKTGSNIKHVKFVSPASKLRVNEDQSIEILTTTKANDKTKVYKVTKELGIKYTKQLIKDDNDLLEYLNGFKKKDDLCDAFLLGYYYLFYKN